MPQLVPFYFLNEVFFCIYNIDNYSIYVEVCTLGMLVKIQLSNNKINSPPPLGEGGPAGTCLPQGTPPLGGLAFFIFKFLDVFNYNSAIPRPVNSGKGKYTIRVQRIFLSSSSLKVIKLPLQLSNKPSST